jgi:hypothetical protein
VKQICRRDKYINELIREAKEAAGRGEQGTVDTESPRRSVQNSRIGVVLSEIRMVIVLPGTEISRKDGRSTSEKY